jgi:hypothetical protein
MRDALRSSEVILCRLSYESCISGSAEACPLLTGHVRCPEITSDHVSQPQFGHKNPVLAFASLSLVSDRADRIVAVCQIGS